ncbi:TlpA family protein disulfide reductase [Enterocloster bolteae]|uniref:TlpA family protein disulfide reductase n=1 Tax=Enterocloster bolteae TaxID=208479 RepID=UPI0034B7A7A7
MRREHFYRNKKALKRSAAGAVLALFLALQITGCSQTADQNKADRKTEQAQGTEKDGLGAEKSSAETEKNGTGTEKPEAAADQGDGVIEFKPGMPIKEGVQAPDFTGELIDGTSITLSELQGKPVIINFWATWCGPCVKEMPAFERLKDDFGDKIGIIAVNCGDDAGTVKDFVEENGYTFPVVLDEEYSISMLYPTNSIPYTVVVDAEGKVTHISTGALDADTMYERYKEALGV